MLPKKAGGDSMLSYEEKRARTWGMLCHLSSLAGFIIPFGHLLGPLIIWLIKKDEYPFVDDQGKESLNFQLTLTLYTIISSILCIILIGFVLLLVLLLAELILVIIASVKANQGETYRYPLTIRFIK
jgi:uncharacterized protein